MSPTAPLTFQYFKIRGRGELCRLLLAAAGAPYIDERLSHADHKPMYDPLLEQWTEVRGDVNRFPVNALPNLIVDGVVIPQSHAINRFIAREYGMMGDTSIEAALIDALADTIIDQRQEWLMAQTDEEKVVFIKTELPKQYSLLEAYAKRHGDGQHFVGSSLSLADVSFYYNHSRFNDSEEQTKLADEVLARMPTLHAINETVLANKGLAKWVEMRPKTFM